MSNDRAPYARLYLSLVDDPKFDGIYDDDRHFAAWCRLLMIAEPSWPASAHLPATIRKASVKALEEAGLIDLQPGGRFRIHGLDAERQRRADQAQRASNARWNAASNAPSIADASVPPMPNREEKEKSTEEPSRGWPLAADACADAWFQTGRRRLPTERQLDFIGAYLATFDASGDERLAALFLANPDDPIGAMKADLKAFQAERRSGAVEQERKSEQTKRRYGLDPENQKLAAWLGLAGEPTA